MVLALVAVVLAAALAGLSWLDARHRIGATQEELARRLHEIESDAREARLLSRQAQEAMRDAQRRAAQIEARLAEAPSPHAALEPLYHDPPAHRPELPLAEIRQVLTLACSQ